MANILSDFNGLEVVDKFAREQLQSHNHDDKYVSKDELPSVPTKTSQLENDSGFIGENAITNHNTSETAHNDVRLLIEGLSARLNALADSDDTTLDQMSEIVAYIKANKELIESVTTTKINVTDIIDNLETNVSNRPLSAKQGVVLKALIDNISVPTKTSDLENDSNFTTKQYVDTMFGTYVNEVAELVGGGA